MGIFLHLYLSFHHTWERTVKEIYYRPVQMKRGVAVAWDEVEVYEPASKKTKRESEEAEKKHEKASDMWSRLSTRELIDVSNYSEASEEREQAGSAGEPPAQEEIPRAKTPEWLVAVDSVCTGCCRVFPSLGGPAGSRGQGA
ncbi:Protein FAM170A [Manis javanica]|nr:Protein FAM170A [Manis javanica]